MRPLKLLFLMFFLTGHFFIFAQDSLQFFKPNIRLGQSFTYIGNSGQDIYGYDYVEKELQMHSRLSLQFLKYLGIGFNYTPIRYKNSYIDTENYKMFGPLIQFYVPEKFWLNRKGKNRSFSTNFELGYYKSDFLLTHYQPIRRELDYLNFGSDFSFHFAHPIYINFGVGTTFLLKNDEEAMQRSLFYYRIGLGWRINLKNEKRQERRNTRLL